jgi:hypothetical protein
MYLANVFKKGSDPEPHQMNADLKQSFLHQKEKIIYQDRKSLQTSGKGSLKGNSDKHFIF